jgi:hypothetical protein
MRIFVRYLPHQVSTLWLDESINVLQAKHFLHQSGQFSFAVEDMKLMCEEIEMKDSDLISKYIKDIPNQVHAQLFKRHDSLGTTKLLSADTYVITHDPFLGSTNASLYEPISLTILATILKEPIADADLSKVMIIRGERNQLVDGIYVQQSTSTLLHEIQFYPTNFASYRKYTIYINGQYFEENDMKCEDFVWWFQTNKLPSLRIVVQPMTIESINTIQDDSPLTDNNNKLSSRLITIYRQSYDLLFELASTIAEEFHIPIFSLYRIYARIFQDQSRDRILPLTNNADISKLTEAHTIIFEYCLATTIPPTLSSLSSSSSLIPLFPGIEEENQTKKWSIEQWEEYKRNNWVNDASGYLAICGKLTETEETELLIQIVSAFGEQEDNRDGIAVNNNQHQLSSSTNAETDSVPADTVPTVPVAVTNTKILQEEAECLIDTILQHSNHPNGKTVSATNDMNLQQFVDSLKDALIPIDMIKPLWTCKPCDYDPPLIVSISSLEEYLDQLDNETLQQQQQQQHHHQQPRRQQHSMITALMERGYCFIEFPEDLQQTLQQCLNEMEEFFTSSCAVKQKLTESSVGISNQLGYKSNELYHKEFFQLRRCPLFAPASWSSNSHCQLPHTMDQLYRELGKVARILIRVILRQYGASSTYIESLFEALEDHESFGYNVSRSNLTAFYYHPCTDMTHNLDPQVSDEAIANSATSAKTAEATVYIPAHSDLSMVTIIPRAEAECGLHVFDWKYQTWFDVDQDCPKHLGLVFVGESISQLMGHRLIPCMHEVSRLGTKPRYSLPFQYCTANKAMLDVNELRLLRDELIEKGEMIPPAIQASRFMDELSNRRVSSNYPRVNYTQLNNAR